MKIVKFDDFHVYNFIKSEKSKTQGQTRGLFEYLNNIPCTVYTHRERLLS